MKNQNGNSRNIHFQKILKQLPPLKDKLKELNEDYVAFREEVLSNVNYTMGKIISLVHREVQMREKIEQQLISTTQNNQRMKEEVVGLRQMIEEFVKMGKKQIQEKEEQIKQLKERLGEDTTHQSFTNNQDLQIIQQVSQGTVSATASAKNSFPFIEEEAVDKQKYHSTQLSSGKKRAKLFLDGFRKTIQESLPQQNEHQSLNSSDIINLGESDKINLPKKIGSPKKLEEVKKKSGKVKTEADEKENICHDKQFQSIQRVKKRTLSVCCMNTNQKNRSPQVAREKIKLTSKITDDSQHSKLSLRMKKNQSVHLGRKNHLKKTVRDVRVAIQQIKIWAGGKEKEVKYEGQKKNGMRWGKGKLLYENGFLYEGSFIKNYKHGIGTISLNGITLYEGQWSVDELHGQGYIHSLKNYCEKCPKILTEASYCGQFQQNKPSGMGTLFLNQNQKFVTKWVHGTPVGQYTYYNHSQIQFGMWL